MSRRRSYPDRQRCLTVGCNPLLKSTSEADEHQTLTGHRTAAWPVRSTEGKRRARIRNKTGYYDKYNVGAKSAMARGLVTGSRGGNFGLSASDMADNGFGDDQ